MALKKKINRRITNENGVNITALMDVMVVLLFFLVHSFTISSIDQPPPEDIRLPLSKTEKKPENAVTVALGERALYVNGQKLLAVSKGRFPAGVIEKDERTLGPLKKVLEEEFNKKKTLYREVGGEELMPPGRILIQADKKLPFKTMKLILHTASVSGYTDYQFITKPDE
jgi:biopolymer transport protein ExbD